MKMLRVIVVAVGLALGVISACEDEEKGEDCCKCTCFKPNVPGCDPAYEPTIRKDNMNCYDECFDRCFVEFKCDLTEWEAC
ncbi:MAG: hypothetical protein QNJ97_02925 [Myxococcota bacterium]|nr:hypothetical protein [Myxococcota bacterium]